MSGMSSGFEDTLKGPSSGTPRAIMPSYGTNIRQTRNVLKGVVYNGQIIIKEYAA